MKAAIRKFALRPYNPMECGGSGLGFVKLASPAGVDLLPNGSRAPYKSRLALAGIDFTRPVRLPLGLYSA